jgi:Raf kinase inhibitor-like YbhB/YbcL family protein
MQINSSAFSDGDAIPRRFTCDGENLSPPLHWSDAPAETRSFVLLCDDPDAPAGIWRHWAVYDLPSDRTDLPEGAGRHGGGKGLSQAINDFGEAAYGGPCPPRGHGLHHYRFRLLALSVDHLALKPEASCRDVDQQARKHSIAESVIVAVYQR